MTRHLGLVLLIALLFAPAFASRSHHSSGGHYRSSYRSHSSYRSRSYTQRTRRSYASHRTSYSYHPRRSYSTRTRSSYGRTSDSHGIKRSAAAKDTFRRQHPCPSTGRSSGACPGYVIDHKKALACGGADDPSNMQWQTTAGAKAKDKWETKGCR